MGNGRWLAGRSGRDAERQSAKRRSAKKNLGSSAGSLMPRALGAAFVLLLAGSALLGAGFRRSAEKSMEQFPAASSSSASRSFLPSQSSSLRLTPLQAKQRLSQPDARSILGQLPLIFEANQGQADSRVKFLARGTGYSLFLDETSAVLTMQTARSAPDQQYVRMKLVGADSAAATAGTNPLPGKSNYILGNDPQRWYTGIPQFAGVRYQSVYPGIDLVFYGKEGRLEYDFKVAPGADPSQAELQFDGANKLKLSGGDLILTGEDEGGLRLQAPHIYQRDGDRQTPVAGRFVLRAANRVAFEIGSYDRSRELIIDPVLDFSTYFGGSGTETSPSVSVNGNGNIYMVGTTQGSPANSFPQAATTPQTLIGPLTLTTSSPAHIFVTEINPSTSTVLYETFIGGSGSDSSVGISVDGQGDAFIAGNTTSTDFPAQGEYYQQFSEAKGAQCASVTCTSVFVSELNPSGSSLTYSSYLSGNGNDQASGMAIDLNGDVFVTGTTTSDDTPVGSDAFPASPGAYQNSSKIPGSIQFFVTELNTRISGPGGITYSTYFGGSTPVPPATCTPPASCNVGGGVAVDAIGNIYFDGTTNFYNSGSGAYGNGNGTSDFPILNAYQPCLDTSPPTVLPVLEQCSNSTLGTVYPTDAFVAKINPNSVQTGAAQLLFSTYLGGMGNDTAAGIAIDSGAANVYLTGSTNSPDFVLPTSTAAYQDCLNSPGVVAATTASCPTTTSNTDAYVARMTNPTLATGGTPNFVQLTYFTYLGGSGNDSGLAIAVLDATNSSLADVVVTGATSSTNFPYTAFPIQSQLLGPQNAFFAQIDTTTVTGQTAVGSYVTYCCEPATGAGGVDRGTGIAVDSSLNSYFVGDTTSSTFTTFNPVQTTLKGARNAFAAKLGPATDLCINCVVPTISPIGIVGAGNQVTTTFTVANEGPDPATFVTVTGTVDNSQATFISGTAGSGTCGAPAQNSVTCQIQTLQAGSTSLVDFIVTPNQSGQYSVNATVSANLSNTSTGNVATATFTAAGYKLFISPSAQNIPAGQIATYGVTVNPSSGFTQANVAFSCSALPQGATCNFTPSSINLANGAQSTSLRLTTTAQPVSTTSAGWHRSLYALWLMVPGMTLLGWRVGGKGRKVRLLGLLMLSLFFALMLLQPACSSTKTPVPVSGTPSGVYPLTVTATSGSFSYTVPFQLTVTP
jgi:hypothetical protein